MMQLDRTYSRDGFLHFLEEAFLTDFKKDIRPASTQGLTSIKKAYSLGRSESLDLQVFEFSFEGTSNKRATLTKDAFQFMRSQAIYRALAIFHSPGCDDWRLSLMTATPKCLEKGKLALSYSNPKRLSFFLGPNTKVNTAAKFLLKRGKINDLDNLRSRFSIEVVHKEFYKEISSLFTQLVGGSLGNGTKREHYEALLKLPSIQDNSQMSLEFAVRLICRIIFCWLLREKKSDQGKSLMPNDLFSLAAVKNGPDYYHNILEPIFFEVLNKPGMSRKEAYAEEPFSSIPYLNGGLFSPHDEDFFSYNEGEQAVNHHLVVIPDEWLFKFFEVLDTYNCTIDENTSFDEELSIDPEMLGRIFENLLAEINPETHESARKSTGSYYTPRVIVDYMVDESLLLYLKNQTQIDEEKLRTILSYDLYDEESPLTDDERENITSALERIKILDPTCGSGAFPIGALQKIVFILQQTDPEGLLWFKKQSKNVPPEIRKVIEREFAHKNFDYIRKLGIIRENIYGVDIQPIATEIAKLRCFLTLVVDECIQEDLENRGIEPLPNLDFKFVTFSSKPISWFEPERMFGIREGFDIVISNPPYISFGLRGTQKMTTEERDLLVTLFPDSAEYKISIYAIFMDKAIQLSKVEGGIQTYIVPDSFLLGRYFSKIRANILRNCEISHLSWLPYKIFEATVGISVVYTFVHRSKPDDNHCLVTRLIQNNHQLADKTYQSFFYPQSYFKAQKHNRFRVFFDQKTMDLVDKIEKGSVPLGNYYTGRTGVRSLVGQRNIVSKKASGETWQPGLISGSQVLKYKIVFEGDYINIDPKLLHKGGWDFEVIHNPKILVRQTSDSLTAALDTNGYYHLNNIHSFAPNRHNPEIKPKYILALINSKLFNWFYQTTTLETGRTMAQTDIETLECLPLKVIGLEEEAFIAMVDKICGITQDDSFLQNIAQQAQVKELEKQIDQMIYKLYGLTHEEIQTVEGGCV